jgi:hypothetical protein
LSSPDTVVNLGYASYQGLLNDTVPDVISWLGVPYAQPPRRFRAAQPLDETPREHKVTDLFEYPEPCVQGWAPEAGCEYEYLFTNYEGIRYLRLKWMTVGARAPRIALK